MDRPLHLGQLEISVVSSSLQLSTLHPTSCWSSSLQITPSTTLDFRLTTHRYTAIDWNNDFWSNLMFPESDNHQATDNNDHSCRSFQMETIHCSILEFDDITDDCGGIEVGSGIIESPYHPANYPNKANCLWYLRGNSASAIVLEFQAFVTENKVDYVSVSLIHSFRSNMNWNIVAVRCGKVGILRKRNQCASTRAIYKPTYLSATPRPRPTCWLSNSFRMKMSLHRDSGPSSLKSIHSDSIYLCKWRRWNSVVSVGMWAVGNTQLFHELWSNFLPPSGNFSI